MLEVQYPMLIAIPNWPLVCFLITAIPSYVLPLNFNFFISYHIVRNNCGIKLWRISKILHSYFGEFGSHQPGIRLWRISANNKRLILFTSLNTIAVAICVHACGNSSKKPAIINSCQCDSGILA